MIMLITLCIQPEYLHDGSPIIGFHPFKKEDRLMIVVLQAN